MPTPPILTPPGNVAAQIARLRDRIDILERQTKVVAPGAAGRGLGSYYNVRDYGAVGDNVTDDTAAIGAAIAAAEAAPYGYGFQPTIYFPPGVYLVSSPLTISVGQTFRGDGTESVIRRKKGSNFGAQGVIESAGYGLFAHHAMCVRDLVIDGNYGYYAELYNDGDPVGGVGSMGLRLDGVASTVYNVVIRDCKQHGFQQRRTSGGAGDEYRPEITVVDGLYLSSCYAGGIYTTDIDGIWHNIVVGHVEFESAHVPGTVGFWVEGSGNKISNVHVYGDLHSSEMYIHGVGNIVTNAVLESPGPTLTRHANTGPGACLYVDGPGNFVHAHLYDNTADHSNKIGLLLGGTRGTVQESYFELYQVSRCDYAGIYLSPGRVGAQNTIRALISSPTMASVPISGVIPDDMTMQVQWAIDVDGDEGGPVLGHYNRSPYDIRFQGVSQLAGPVVRDEATGTYYRIKVTGGVLGLTAV